MKKILFSFVAVMCFIAAQSQVKIAIVKDNPEEVENYRVRIPLWMINLANHNLSGYNAKFGLDIQPSQKFLLNVDYNYQLLEKLSPETAEGSEFPAWTFAESDKEPSHSNYFNLEANYFFKSVAVPVELNITLKTTGNVRYYTMVPGTELKKFGIRAGYKKGITWYHMGDAELHTSDPNSTILTELTDKSTMLQYSQLRLGFAYSKSTNLFIKAEGYGDRSNTGNVLWYGDLLLGLQSKIDDMYLIQRSTISGEQNDFYYTHYDVDAYNDKAKIGFEVGVRYLPYHSAFGYQAAFGRLNGIKGGPNGYLELGAVISLGSKTSAGSEKDTKLYDSAPRK